jgi:hypothetical protein
MGKVAPSEPFGGQIDHQTMNIEPAGSSEVELIERLEIPAEQTTGDDQGLVRREKNL